MERDVEVEDPDKVDEAEGENESVLIFESLLDMDFGANACVVVVDVFMAAAAMRTTMAQQQVRR